MRGTCRHLGIHYTAFADAASRVMGVHSNFNLSIIILKKISVIIQSIKFDIRTHYFETFPVIIQSIKFDIKRIFCL